MTSKLAEHVEQCCHMHPYFWNAPFFILQNHHFLNYFYELIEIDLKKQHLFSLHETAAWLQFAVWQFEALNLAIVLKNKRTWTLFNNRSFCSNIISINHKMENCKVETRFQCMRSKNFIALPFAKFTRISTSTTQNQF